jgi:ATP-dependent DNA helicase RecG
METPEALREIGLGEDSSRQFKAGGLLHGDDVPVPGTSAMDLDVGYFREFFRKRFERDLDEEGLTLENALSNMRLLAGGRLTVSGALLFAKFPESFLPAFHVKAVAYPGTDIHVVEYLESADYSGRLQAQFEGALAFSLRHMRRVQNGRDINSLGELEIPKIVFEELIANALIHRDYFVSAPVRLFIFDDRIEIVSPGHLPNNLTVENIRSGTSNMRNPILASYATAILPYRGLGTGVRRALREYPRIDFEDDRERNEFRAIIRRRL